ncbi:MAG: 2-amino-4-hydroxy-6-hydroxymethyldihydropteridine diphosphokinase [Bacteroidota bacterium]
MIDRIYLLMGSNLGDRFNNLKLCMEELRKEVGKITKTSSVYETAAWGITEQNPFLNLAVEIVSDLNPSEMIDHFERIERKLGRKKVVKWGPRIIDVDILYFNDVILKTPSIQIPHKEIQNRRFALEPMIEINPSFQHPVFNVSQIDLLKNCKDPLDATKLNLQIEDGN